MIDPSSVSTGAWFTEQCSNHYVAAYQAGRLSNCLDWLLLRRAICDGLPGEEELEKVLTRLTEITHRFDETGGGLAVRNEIKQIRTEFTGGSFRFLYELACAEEKSDVWSQEIADQSEGIRHAFCESLDSQGEACLALGRRLDQGLRPLRLEYSELMRLARAVRIESARLPREPLWQGDIQRLFRQLGIRCALLEGTADATPDKMVAALDESIRGQLNAMGRIGGKASLIADAEEIVRLKEIKDKIDPDGEYIGRSLSILGMFEKIDLYNQTRDDRDRPPYPVLLLGKTGAGKTVLGKLIHRHSGRPLAKYMYVQATTTRGTDEATVRHYWLGHGKSSALQGVGRKAQDGIIQRCQGGTIFVDELHVAPAWFQTLLLQVIDGTEMHRTAGISDPVCPDVRLLLASNRTLQELEECVIHDLLDRLRRWTIEVPPLRRRKEDIVYFVKTWCMGHKWDYRFLLALFQYDWPGNVRELKETLELSKRELRKALERNKRKAESTSGKLKRTLKRSKRKVESTSGTLTLDNLHLGEPGIVDAVRRLDKEEAEREVWLFLIHSFEKQGLRKGGGLHKHLADLDRKSVV